MREGTEPLPCSLSVCNCYVQNQRGVGDAAPYSFGVTGMYWVATDYRCFGFEILADVVYSSMY